MLVDDHPANITALEAILEPLGERLLRASSGADAVTLATAEPLALILLDLQMPELDGLETAALIKKTARSRSVPIIILTAGEPSRAEVARGYASGAVDFLYKPLDPDVLRSKVAVFVELYKQRRDGGRTSEERIRAEVPRERVSERLLSAPPQEALRIVEALVRLSTAMGQDLEPSAIAQRFVDEVTDLTAAAHGAFYHRGPGDRQAVAVAASVTGPDLEAELLALGPGSSLVAPAFLASTVVRHGDVRSLLGGAGSVRSVLAVPVVLAGGALDGVLVLVDAAPEAFDAQDEALATIAAHHAAVARANARHYEAARDARDRAELAELELRAGEARLRFALEASGLGTWDHSPRTGAFRWDARARALLGAPDAEVVDLETYVACVHPEDRARVRAAIGRALDPASFETYDVEHRTRAGVEGRGRARWVAVKGQAIVEQGRAVRFIGIVHDCTAKKLVEEERGARLESESRARADAESASRAKDEFLATVSHELRNPLNAILGWSRVLLEERDIEPARLRKGLEVIARNSKAQVQLVEDILEVSRIVAGTLRLTKRLVEVRPVVEAAMETVRSSAETKGVALAHRFENAPGTIVADEDRLQQILSNLLSNAVKFTPAGGHILLTVRRDSSALVLTVEDDGEGIEPAFLPYVFDRFRQADPSTTRRFGGLGLGLAIVRHLVEIHGGGVSATSEGKGKGATFAFRLPIPIESRGGARTEDGPPESRLPASRPLDPRPPSARSPACPLAGRTIMVLDDEDDMRDLVAMILEHAGAEVVRVSSVDRAMVVLGSAPPDVALSDLAMPGEDGYAFVARVRRSPSTRVRGLRLVAMTAYARAEDRERVLDAGFDRHVAKPVEPSELIAVLAELLDD